MSTKRSDRETKFEKYRELLYVEAVRLAGFVALYRHLHELRSSALNEMNMAPGFFQIVIESLFSTIVIWVHKMFHPKSERGLHDFLNFCQQILGLFDISELQRRRSYNADHWMLEGREPISQRITEKSRHELLELECLPSFKLRRDKFHAHFDSRYFFDRKKLAEDAPLRWSDLDRLMEVVEETINTYSDAYDGRVYRAEPINANDVDSLLECARVYADLRRAKAP